ncbi:MAG TPA: type IV pilin protein [Nitrospira sp.]|nr:type IV pilin protein [Nitrospira sp.]
MHRFHRNSAGFSLIELMVVVAVIGIMAVVGFPSYNDYIIRGRIAEATSALSDGRVRIEQFFQDNKTYAGGACPPATESFTYDCSNLTNTTYTITANGNAGSSVSDFSFSIDQSNTRKTTGTKSGWAGAALPQDCWITKRGGVC